MLGSWGLGVVVGGFHSVVVGGNSYGSNIMGFHFSGWNGGGLSGFLKGLYRILTARSEK